MNANDWKFTRLVPETSDFIVEYNTMETWFALMLERNMPDPFNAYDAFSAGFTRGMKWAQDKEEFLNE